MLIREASEGVEMERALMTKKENYLKAIKFEDPEYVPFEDDHVIVSFSFEEIVKQENWTDRWGIDWKKELDGTVPFPKGNPLADLEKVKDYKFPNPETLQLSGNTRNILEHVDKSSVILSGNMSYLLFERAWALTGLESFMMDLCDYPDEVKYLLHEIAKYAKSVFARYVDLGAEMIGFSEDLGSQRALMMSPSAFREFLMPEYDFIFGDLVKNGILIHFHSCGCVDAIAGDLAEIGVSILNPVQAKANDLSRLKRDTLGKMALSGAVDTATILMGTPEEVRNEVIRVMRILKPGGGYICAPDQYFPNFPQKNMDMLKSTAIEFGKY